MRVIVKLPNGNRNEHNDFKSEFAFNSRSQALEYNPGQRKLNGRWEATIQCTKGLRALTTKMIFIGQLFLIPTK